MIGVWQNQLATSMLVSFVKSPNMLLIPDPEGVTHLPDYWAEHKSKKLVMNIKYFGILRKNMSRNIMSRMNL